MPIDGTASQGYERCYINSNQMNAFSTHMCRVFANRIIRNEFSFEEVPSFDNAGDDTAATSRVSLWRSQFTDINDFGLIQKRKYKISCDMFSQSWFAIFVTTAADADAKSKTILCGLPTPGTAVDIVKDRTTSATQISIRAAANGKHDCRICENARNRVTSILRLLVRLGK